MSGLTLSYDERRVNCVPIDSDVYPAEPWPYLRVWTDASGADPYLVLLRDYATPCEGSYQDAWCEFELSGTITQGDYAGLAFCGEHYTHQNYYDDTIDSVIEQIGRSINSSSRYLSATWEGAKIRLESKESSAGSNGNRIGVYSYVAGAASEQWSHPIQTLQGGSSPARWHIELPFSEFPFPMDRVRKMRWTYAADLQPAEFERTEFEVEVSNWTVSGSNRRYKLAGPESRRLENDSAEVSLSSGWQIAHGNFSGGSLAFTSIPGESAEIRFATATSSIGFLGTRRAESGGPLLVTVDGVETRIDLGLAGEDTLVRIPLGPLSVGTHVVTLRHDGASTETVFFDYFEAAVPSEELTECAKLARCTLATDWDTDHAIALPAERTAGMLRSLGFTGRANHYVGALWFYEIAPNGFRYAVKRISFSGNPEPNSTVVLQLAGGRIEHLVHPGDTAETIATALSLRLNQGYTSVWASASQAALSIQARMMGAAGNQVDVSVGGGGPAFSGTPETVQAGVDGVWRTDLTAQPRMNRAARDWTRAYLRALDNLGIGATCAFSMELQHGDPSAEAGIAQRYPSGNPVQLQTPAIQTNFSPTSIAFWRQVYLDCATLMVEAGVRPYLQFGEVQWWYFPDDGSGMPFCDAYTDQVFSTEFGRTARRIPNERVDPAEYQDETGVYRRLAGEFTVQLMQFVKQRYPDCRFEVLYPTDVNSTAFNRAVNFAGEFWTAASLDCLKTESFTFTLQRDLNLARSSILFGSEVGFPWTQRSHLVGISDPSTPWSKEVATALESGVESAVLFALDQYCLIGSDLSQSKGRSRSGYFEL
ncbi:MAG: hypothetical protein IT160_20755 [Bryobacterales bacterium]|nr:hypothetical protein [Bryobacterales bacterium]